MKKLRSMLSKKAPHCDTSADSSPATVGSPPKEFIEVRVIYPSARILVFSIDTTKRLVDLKNEAIFELANDPVSLPIPLADMRQLSPKYRLIRAEFEGIELNELQSLADAKIQNNDAFILTPRRTDLARASLQGQNTKPPHDDEIDIATRKIKPKNNRMPVIDVNEIFQQSNLQFDVRKVLISLAQASATLIGAGPYATRLISRIKQKLINKRNYQKDSQQCLIDMGFTAEQAEYALRMHNGAYAPALEYLIHFQSGATRDKMLALQKSQSLTSPSSIMTNDNVVENTAALLEIVNIYGRRDIPPTPNAVKVLIEMGFEEPDVLAALRKTGNNKAAACEWLCGNRTGSLFELREGLAPDSPILRAILELPKVQMELSDPKTLLAFLSLLENPNSLRVWGSDNDSMPIVTNILQKYHEEKHVLGINQFYRNRI